MLRQYHRLGVDGSDGELLSGEFACPSLMVSVDIAARKQQGGKNKKKEIMPLLREAGGQHRTAELTNKKNPQFSSV